MNSPGGLTLAKRRSRRRISKEELEMGKIAALVFGSLILIAVVYVWVSTHIVESVLIGLALIGFMALVVWKNPKARSFFQKVSRTYGKVNDKQVKSLIDNIKGIRMQEVRNEEDFEKQLYQRLSAKGMDVVRQVPLGSGRRVDMVVDNKIAVELKIADRAKNVQDLIGQVTIYHQQYKNIVVGILDVGEVENIEEYIQFIQNVDPEKINVVLVKGELRRRKKKEEYIMVKKKTGYG